MPFSRERPIYGREKASMSLPQLVNGLRISETGSRTARDMGSAPCRQTVTLIVTLSAASLCYAAVGRLQARRAEKSIAMRDTVQPIETSTLRCPQCGAAHTETMPL